MGRRRRGDATDLACYAWARERRRLLGLDEPRTARETVGPVRSTLGRIRVYGDGAGATRPPRGGTFPEVYTGDAFAVNRAYHAMRPDLRRVMDVHYVARAPIDDKAEALAMSVRSYFNRVNVARAFVEGFLARPDGERA